MDDFDIVVNDQDKLVAEVLLIVKTEYYLVLEINTRSPYSDANEFYVVNPDGSQQVGVTIYPDEVDSDKQAADITFDTPFMDYITFINRVPRGLTLAFIARDSEQDYGVLYRNRNQVAT